MNTKHILVTGGAGYLGAVLVPKLLAAHHRVTVLDCLLFGAAPLDAIIDHPSLSLIQADIRDHPLVDQMLMDGHFDVVIHLAAISNDPSSDLDPDLTKSVNLDAVRHLMQSSKRHGVGRFLYASSASVYGIKEDAEVTEDLPLQPITLYAKYKAECEEILWNLIDENFVGVAVRAATVCGWSPRLRLDLTINILTTHAIHNGRIRVFGGSQLRPNIHIQDLTDFYFSLLDAPSNKVQGQAFNISKENASVMELAKRIRNIIDPELPIDVVPTNDLRSYHLSTGKVRSVLKFEPKLSLDQAIRDLQAAYADGRIPNHTDSIYRNVNYMTEHSDFWSFTK